MPDPVMCGDPVARERFDTPVQFGNPRVVEASSGADAVVGDREFMLQSQGVLLRVERGIPLAKCDHRTRRVGQFGLGSRPIGRGVRCVGGSLLGVDQGMQQRSFVFGGGADGLDRSGNQRVPTFEFDIDRRP